MNNLTLSITTIGDLLLEGIIDHSSQTVPLVAHGIVPPSSRAERHEKALQWFAKRQEVKAS